MRCFFTPHFYGLCWKCQNTEIRRFLPNVAVIRRTCRIFTAKGAAIWQKAKDCGVLQDGALRCSHQSAVLLPSKCGTFGGRKRRDLRHFFKCYHAVFVAFFLTRTVCRKFVSKKHHMCLEGLEPSFNQERLGKYCTSVYKQLLKRFH